MIRRRVHARRDEDSSSEEDDAFAALSKKSKKPKHADCGSDNHTKNEKPSSNNTPTIKLPVALTSSMKRHHKPNDMRKAKMDALLQELEAENKKVSREPQRFVPEKKGSYVEPSEEHLTTNIFVGNLAPSVTEEDLTELFLQFGELYSIKIMWPRTQTERSRKRNTGFVCFMNREDAEEAMEACNETDPFNVGRLLMMRWGKNVKKNVRQGAGGGLSIHPLQKAELESSIVEEPQLTFHAEPDATERYDGPPSVIELRQPHQRDISKAPSYDSKMHTTHAFHVELPSDPDRFHFISTVAQYIAKDGSSLEQSLIESEGGNPLFNFLTLNFATEQQRKEHLFYRWRVFSFCQGDGFYNWRTEPFVMFHPHGRFWIPPPLDELAARQKNYDERDESFRRNRGDRRNVSGKREYLTGRQLERARSVRRKGKGRAHTFEGGDKLTVEELHQFDLLVRKKLSVSRETICSAMAFCFEKSASAKEIAALLNEVLMDDSPTVSVDTRIARLYLLSDILFNSQQPGVKNAFMYRDALEKMAPDIFTSLGRHGGGNVGRMTMNKLKTAVSTVLGAWTEWSVYNPTFLDELEARFDGKELTQQTQSNNSGEPQEKKDAEEGNDKPLEAAEIISNQPRGDWTQVDDMVDGDSESETGNEFSDNNTQSKKFSRPLYNESSSKLGPGRDGRDSQELDFVPPGFAMGKGEAVASHKGNGAETPAEVEDIDGAPVDDDDIDGAPLHDTIEDVDGSPVDDEDSDGAPENEKKVPGAELKDDEDVDGDPIDGDDIDGVAVEHNDLDGSPIEDDLDGEPIYENGEARLGSEAMKHNIESSNTAKDVKQDLDGEFLTDDDLDGEAIDDSKSIDGEEL